MPIDRSKKPGRHDKYTPNVKENEQVVAAMRKAGVPVTPENKDKVHRAISGQRLNNFQELVKGIKMLFGK